MTTPFAGYQQSLAYSAAKDRAIMSVGLAHGLNGLADDGVVNGTTSNFECTVSSGLYITVASGVAMVAGYKVVVPASTSLTVATPGSYARRDLVILRVWDTESGDSSSKVTVELVTGTGITDPILPPNSLILWQTDVAANGSTVTLTDRRKYTGGAGATKLVQKIADITPASVPPGTVVYDLTTGRRYKRTSSATVWLPDGSNGPLTYTPTWFSNGGNNPVASVKRGFYTLKDGVCSVWVYIVAAANGGGTKSLGVTLPVRATPAIEEQTIRCKFFTPGFGNYLGSTVVPANTVNALPYFPESALISRISPWVGSADGTPGNGVPVWDGQYTIQAGSNFTMSGSYMYDVNNP